MKQNIQNSGVKRMNQLNLKPLGLVLVSLLATPLAQATNYGKYDVLSGTFFMSGGVTPSPVAITSEGIISTSPSIIYDTDLTLGVLYDSTYKTTPVFQGPTPSAPYPNSPVDETVRNNTDILDPFLFFGSNVGTYTAVGGVDNDGIPFDNGADIVIPDASTDPHPGITIDLNAGTADMSAFYAYWSGNEFNQGSSSAVVTDNGDGTYQVEWSSLIVGGPFHGFTGTWTMEIECFSGYICTNEAPVANDDSAGTEFQVPVNIDVTANDTDADGTINPATVTIIADATNGITSVNPTTGVVTYTPNTGYTGPDSFTYTVEDNLGLDAENDFGATSNTATVNITVSAAGTPNAVSDSASTAFATPVDIDVTANDNATAFGETIDVTTVTITTAANYGGTAVNGTTGVVTYTPSASFFGTDSFAYTVQDTVGTTSNAANVTITVASPPRATQPTDRTTGAIPLVTIDQGSGNTRTITNDGGNFTVSVDTSAAFYDQYSWTGTSIEIVGDQSVTPPTLGGLTAHWTDASSSITVDPSTLTVGNHLIRVKMWDIDATPSAGATVNIIISVLASGTTTDYVDTDNDGILDSADDGALAVTQLQTEVVGTDTYVMESSSGNLGLGTSAKCTGKTGAAIALVDFSEIDASNNCVALTGTADIANAVQTGIGGYFDFEVRNLTAGETVSIAIPLNTALPKNAGYRKYTKSAGWRAFETTGSDAIASANATATGTCPAPTSTSAWTSGLTEGHNCIRLTITDGGDNDADGVANGVIIDPGTIAGYAGISTQGVTIGGGWWLLLSFPALLVMRRQSK